MVVAFVVLLDSLKRNRVVFVVFYDLLIDILLISRIINSNSNPFFYPYRFWPFYSIHLLHPHIFPLKFLPRFNNFLRIYPITTIAQITAILPTIIISSISVTQPSFYWNHRLIRHYFFFLYLLGNNQITLIRIKRILHRLKLFLLFLWICYQFIIFLLLRNFWLLILWLVLVLVLILVFILKLSFTLLLLFILLLLRILFFCLFRLVFFRTVERIC